MANIDRFMVAPILSGQQQDSKPWLIPDDAFEELTNAYIFRGRVRKRFGAKLMNSAGNQLGSRLRLKVGKTDLVTGNKSVTAPGAIWKVGQLFSVGTTLFTVVTAGVAQPTLTTSLVATATYNTTNGALVITGNGENPDADIYFYPSTPVMGLRSYESSFINDEPVVAFDQQFSYLYTNGAWELAGAITDKWTGSDSDFFWTCNWRGINAQAYNMYTVNGVAADGIRFWNGTAWTKMDPPKLNAGGTVLDTAEIVIPYHGRMLAINTTETGVRHPSRVRWSQLGDPVTTAINNTAWLEDAGNNGGFLDATTKEQIVSCAFIKDHLILYFERSTWELVFTGNEANPFYFQRINQELGAESTFSVIPFDKVILGVGNVGVHACNGANVERVDNKIPDSVFNISNGNTEVKRVYGIRDYYTQCAYWTFPNSDLSNFPNKILVYNYLTMSWAFNDDSVTCFGYYQDRSIGETWENTTKTWEEITAQWNSATFESRFRNILAGNQEGFVFILAPEISTNSESLQITNMTYVQIDPTSWAITITADQHNLSIYGDDFGDYIKIKYAQGLTTLNDMIFKVQSIIDENKFTVIYISPYPPVVPPTGTYTGGGTLTRVSNFNITTKQYNFYMQQGRNAYISKIDFYVDKTDYGEFTVDSYIGSSNVSLLKDSKLTKAAIGTSIVETAPYAIYTYEESQDRLWHPVYLQGDGECVQLVLSMSKEQMVDPYISESNFELNAMTFYATPTSSRLQ